MLERIAVILVETTHPGNIGATARAMKNMGLRELRLVNPRRFPHPDATAMAAGADDLLEAAQVYPTLDEALADRTLVFGASARARSIPWPTVEPREAAARGIAEAARGAVAVVFGREHSGLSNEELDRCNYLLTIPSDPGFSSLNVAQSVQVVAYELRLAARTAPPAPVLESDWVQAEHMEKLYAHLETTLMALGFLDPNNPKHLMRRLRRMFNRTRLDQNELNILRGMLTAVDAMQEGRLHLRGPSGPGKPHPDPGRE